jgi:hypothetical protein
VSIGDGVESIKEYAFKNCSALSELRLSKSVKQVGYESFSGCTGMTTIDLGEIETISEKAFSGCQSIVAVMLPHSLKEVGSGAFSGCNSIATVPPIAKQWKAIASVRCLQSSM